MPAARTYIHIALAAVLAAACSKSEPPPAAKSPPQAAAPAAPVAPARPGEIDEGLKERLARQEAAARMFESKVLSPPPPAASIPTAPAALPVPSAAPVAPPKVESPKPGQVTPPPQVEPVKGEPKAEAPRPQAAPQPRAGLAAARPVPAPEPPAATRLISRVDPEFPREAASSGYEQGNVKARMTLDAAGSVTRVEILAANPRRVFDRAVIRALSQWRYSEGAAGRTVDMEVDFRR